MSFDLAVWYSDKPVTVEESGGLYLKLCNQEWVPTDENPLIESFYQELCRTYPEIDTLPENQVDECPWSCAHDRSGLHVLMCMGWGGKTTKVAEYIVELAAKNGLVCYDPQGPDVYLPPSLKLQTPTRSRFRLW
ncbi:MAG: hypothetical protein ABI833_17775 [Acidobacteriota bacterium]